jgi:hypothetical protein
LILLTVIEHAGSDLLMRPRSAAGPADGGRPGAVKVKKRVANERIFLNIVENKLVTIKKGEG